MRRHNGQAVPRRPRDPERRRRGRGRAAGRLSRRVPPHRRVPRRGAARTWLTRIVVNQALMRLRRQQARRHRRALPGRASRDGRPEAEVRDDEGRIAVRGDAARRDAADPRAPDRRAAGGVPHGVRHARSRGHERARRRPRACRSRRRRSGRACSARGRCCAKSLARDVDVATGDVFAFAGARCDRIVATCSRDCCPAERNAALSLHPIVSADFADFTGE